MKFTLYVLPEAQKRPRSRAIIHGNKAFAMTYKDTEQRVLENRLIGHLLQHKPEEPFRGGLFLMVRAFLPVPKSRTTGKKGRKFLEEALAGKERPTTKPDMDNLVKHFKDCAKGILWQDDKQVVSCLSEKFYGDPPRWEIEVFEV